MFGVCMCESKYVRVYGNNISHANCDVPIIPFHWTFVIPPFLVFVFLLGNLELFYIIFFPVLFYNELAYSGGIYVYSIVYAWASRFHALELEQKQFCIYLLYVSISIFIYVLCRSNIIRFSNWADYIVAALNLRMEHRGSSMAADVHILKPAEPRANFDIVVDRRSNVWKE